MPVVLLVACTIFLVHIALPCKPLLRHGLWPDKYAELECYSPRAHALLQLASSHKPHTSLPERTLNNTTGVAGGRKQADQPLH